MRLTLLQSGSLRALVVSLSLCGAVATNLWAKGRWTVTPISTTATISECEVFVTFVSVAKVFLHGFVVQREPEAKMGLYPQNGDRLVAVTVVLNASQSARQLSESEWEELRPTLAETDATLEFEDGSTAKSVASGSSFSSSLFYPRVILWGPLAIKPTDGTWPLRLKKPSYTKKVDPFVGIKTFFFETTAEHWGKSKPSAIVLEGERLEIQVAQWKKWGAGGTPELAP